MPPMPHFLFGGRNILNECGVVDGCKWHSLLYEGEVVLVGRDGIGWVRMALLIIYGEVVAGVPSEVRRKGCAFLFGI